MAISCYIVATGTRNPVYVQVITRMFKELWMDRSACKCFCVLYRCAAYAFHLFRGKKNIEQKVVGMKVWPISRCWFPESWLPTSIWATDPIVLGIRRISQLGSKCTVFLWQKLFLEWKSSWDHVSLLWLHFCIWLAPAVLRKLRPRSGWQARKKPKTWYWYITWFL